MKAIFSHGTTNQTDSKTNRKYSNLGPSPKTRIIVGYEILSIGTQKTQEENFFNEESLQTKLVCQH